MYGAFSPASTLGVKPSAFFNVADRQRPFDHPHLDRAIFINADANEWRDAPGFNSYFLRAAFPSLSVEVASDWDDRVAMSSTEKAWHLPLVLLTDRSAAHRGETCGSKTQRIAAEAFEYMLTTGGLDSHGAWWQPLRHSLQHFAGGVSYPHTASTYLDAPILITYISRQAVRRHLLEEDHTTLIQAIEAMVQRNVLQGSKWTFEVVMPEDLTLDEQVILAGRTTVCILQLGME
jgi:hypothetical protein